MSISSRLTKIVRSVLWNASSRVRAGWRIFVCFFLCSVGWAIGDTAAVAVFDGFADEVAQVVVNVSVVVVCVAVTARFLDQRKLADFGLSIDREWFLDLFAGLLIGALMTAVSFAVFFASGWASIDTVHPINPSVVAITLVGIVTMGCVSLNEELLFRGYILTNLVDGFQWVNRTIAVIVGVVLSSLFFVLFHANPFGDWSVTLHFFLTGILYALPLILRGRLAMGIGIHMMNNFIIGYIFGLGDEAVGVGPSILTIEQGSASFWFGSAGMVQTIVLVAAMLAVFAWTRWREGRVIPTQWRTLVRETTT